MIARSYFLTLTLLAASSYSAMAQQAPAIGYMYPSGGCAGQSLEVTLGGYDWTPDMQLFVHDPRIKLEILAPPGPVIVPEPPYWFGKKARRPPFLLPRETRARLTIPSGVKPGIIRWQAANANGGSAAGKFIVNRAADDGCSTTEVDDRSEPQQLILPAIVFGQIKKIQEVDQYQFTLKQPGLVTCATTARATGSPLNAVIEVFDSTGRRVADAADTAGNDTALTFNAKANEPYTVGVYDVDFRGNRAFVYQLSITPGPRVVASVPAIVQRGKTQSVEFVGYGIATGTAKLESIKRDVAVPADAHESFHYQLDTPFGITPQFALTTTETAVTVETADMSRLLTLPCSLTGVLDQRYRDDRYKIAGTKGDTWRLRAITESIRSPLDVTLAVFNAEGKELARNDDVVPGSTDAILQYKVPEDGEYEIRVADVSGNTGNRAATYHLTAEILKPNFSIPIPELLNINLGAKGKLALKVKRTPGFIDAIKISFVDLPSGVTVPDQLVVAEKKTALNVELTSAADEAATASLVRIVAESQSDEQTIRHELGPILITTTIKPPFSVDAEGKDDVTKWPRGTTFPYPVLIEREEGFDKEIVLEMSSRQGRHRQGITGPELAVSPGVERFLYPIFLPEWLETTRTSRMVVNGVAKIPDPKGNFRYSVSRQKTRMGFLPTGALLKLSTDTPQIQAKTGQQLSIPLTISRSLLLKDPIRLELIADDSFMAEPVTLSPEQSQTEYRVVHTGKDTPTEHTVKIRATAMKEGKYPAISETSVLILFGQ